jgi:hypothetical protein
MRGDKSAAAASLVWAAEIAYAQFNNNSFPADLIEKAAIDTLTELNFAEDVDIYGHVLGRIPKKRIHSLFYLKIKNILFLYGDKNIKHFNKALLQEIRDVTEPWGAESNGYQEVAD